MTRLATPSSRRQPLLAYVLNYLRETGYRLFHPGRGNGVILELPAANPQIENPLTNPDTTPPRLTSPLSDDESEWVDATQEEEETENDQIDYEVKDILELLLCQLEAECQDIESTSLDSDIRENLNYQLKSDELTEKSTELESDETVEVEELNQKLSETTAGGELQARNKIENDYEIAEDVRKTLFYIMDQLEDYPVLQSPYDCFLVNLVTDENSEAMVTEVVETEPNSGAMVPVHDGNSEILVTEGSSETLVAEGISGIMLTKINIAIEATNENSDPMDTQINSETIETGEHSETILNNENSETIVTRSNSYTLVTEGNFGTIATIRNSGTIVTIENSEPMVTEINPEPMTTEVTPEPMTVEVTPEAMATKINAEPMVIDINSEPMVIVINSEPMEIEINSELMAIEINFEPMVNEETSETKVTGRTSGTIVDGENSDVMFTDERKIERKSYTARNSVDFPTKNHLEDEIYTDIETRKTFENFKQCPTIKETRNDPSLSSKSVNREKTPVLSIDNDSDELESNILGKHSCEDLAGSSLKRAKSFYEIENETLSLTDLIKIHNETYEVLNKTRDQLKDTNENCRIDRDDLRDPNVQILTEDSVDKRISEANLLSENSNSSWVFSNNPSTGSTKCDNGSRLRETNSFLNLDKVHSTSSFENECRKPLEGKKNQSIDERYVESPPIKSCGTGDVSIADLEYIQRIKEDVWTPFKKGTLQKSKPDVPRASSVSSCSSNAINIVRITPKPHLTNLSSEKSLSPQTVVKRASSEILDTQSVQEPLNITESYSKTFPNIPLTPKSPILSDFSKNDDPSSVKHIRDQPGYKSHSFHYGPNTATLNMSFEYGIKASRDEANSQIVFKPITATEMPGCRRKGYETTRATRRNLKTSCDERDKSRLHNRKPYARSCAQKRTL